MSVTVEKKGPVTTVILDRPEARNAVDRPTAEDLAEAFRQFDADEEARVSVFYGTNATFCAGADLKALADESRGNRIAAQGDGGEPYAAFQTSDWRNFRLRRGRWS